MPGAAGLTAAVVSVLLPGDLFGTAVVGAAGGELNLKLPSYLLLGLLTHKTLCSLTVARPLLDVLLLLDAPVLLPAVLDPGLTAAAAGCAFGLFTSDPSCMLLTLMTAALELGLAGPDPFALLAAAGVAAAICAGATADPKSLLLYLLEPGCKLLERGDDPASTAAASVAAALLGLSKRWLLVAMGLFALE
jgi:hypothetical protein